MHQLRYLANIGIGQVYNNCLFTGIKSTIESAGLANYLDEIYEILPSYPEPFPTASKKDWLSYFLTQILKLGFVRAIMQGAKFCQC